MCVATWEIEFKLYSVIHVFRNTIIHCLKTSVENLVVNLNPYLKASVCIRLCIKVFQNTLILVVLYSASLRIHVFDNTGFPRLLRYSVVSQILICE